MHLRHAAAGVLAAAITVSAACGGSAAPAPNLPAIVAQSIAYHGGALYEGSAITMTITSLSGSFDIEATRDRDAFEYIVTNPARGDRPERRVRLSNDGVTEWLDGVQSDLDAEGERRATAFANARVFFPPAALYAEGGRHQLRGPGPRPLERPRAAPGESVVHARHEQRRR